MGPDRLDKFIKNQVEQHKTPTDPDLLWQKIQAKQNVEEKPKRRFLIFWLLGGALLLTSLAGLYTYQFLNTDGTLSENENPIENTTTNNSANETTSTNSNSNINSNTRSSSNSNTTDLSDKTSPSSNLAIEDKKPNEHSNETASRSSNDSDITVVNNAKPNKTNTSTGNDRFATAKTKTTNSANTDSNTPSTPSSNTGLTTDNNEEPSIASTTTIEEKELNQDPLPSGKQENTSDNAEANINTFAKSELLLISKLDFLLADQDIAVQFIEAQDTVENFPSYTFNKKIDLNQINKWSFSNGLAFTYGTAPRTLSDRDSTPAEYLQTRNDMETSLDAVRINLDFMAQHNKSGFYLKSGIEYEQINERFDAYTTWDSTVIDPNQILAITYAMDGSRTDSTGNGENLSTFFNQKKSYNRYHSIDIPFLVAYNSAKGDKKDKNFAWFVEGGVSVNLWFKARGEIYDTANRPIRLEDNPNLFKPQTGFSLMAATGVSYRLPKSFSIWASPTVKYHLNSITSNENTLKQKYLNVGLQVGIRYHWIK